MNPTTKSSENIVGAARTAAVPTRSANPSTADLAQRTAAQAAIDTIPLQYQSSFYAAYSDSANYPPPAAIPSNPNYGLLVRRTGEINPGFVSVAQNTALIGGSTRWLNNIFSGVYDEMFADADSNLMATQKDRDNFFEAVRGQPYGELIYRRYRLGEYADVSRPSELIASVSYDLARQQALADIGNATGFTQFAGGMLGGFARPDQLALAAASFGLSLGPAAIRAGTAALSTERTVRYGTRVIQAERKVAERLGAMLDMRYGAGTATVQPLTLGERLRAASSAFTSSSTARNAQNSVLNAMGTEATGLVPFTQAVQAIAQQTTTGIAARTIARNGLRAIGEGALYAGVDATIEYNTFGERTLGQSVDDFVANVAADVVFSGLMQTPGIIGKIRQEMQGVRSARDFVNMPEPERAAAFAKLQRQYNNLRNSNVPEIEFTKDVDVPLQDADGATIGNRRMYVIRISERDAAGNVVRTNVVRMRNLSDVVFESENFIANIDNAIAQRQTQIDAIDPRLTRTNQDLIDENNRLWDVQQQAQAEWNTARQRFEYVRRGIENDTGEFMIEDLDVAQQARDELKVKLDEANRQYDASYQLIRDFQETRAAQATRARQEIEQNFQTQIENIFLGERTLDGVFGPDDTVARRSLAAALIDDVVVNNRNRYDADNVYVSDRTVLDERGNEIPDSRTVLPPSFDANQTTYLNQLAEVFASGDKQSLAAALLNTRLQRQYESLFATPGKLTIGGIAIDVERLLQMDDFREAKTTIVQLQKVLEDFQQDINDAMLRGLTTNRFLGRLQELLDNKDLTNAERVENFLNYFNNNMEIFRRMEFTPISIDLMDQLMGLKLRAESQFLLENFDVDVRTWFDDAIENVRGNVEQMRRDREIATRNRDRTSTRLNEARQKLKQTQETVRQKFEDLQRRGQQFVPDAARTSTPSTDASFDFMQLIEQTSSERTDVVHEDIGKAESTLGAAFNDTLDNASAARGGVTVRGIVNEFFGNVIDEIVQRLGIVNDAKTKVRRLRLANRKDNVGIYWQEAKQQLIAEGNANPTTIQILARENALKDADLEGISTADRLKLIGTKSTIGAVAGVATVAGINRLPQLLGYNTTLAAILLGQEPQETKTRGVVGESSVRGGYDITQYLDPAFVDAMRAGSNNVLSDRATTIQLRSLIRNSTNMRLAQDAIDMLNTIDGNSTPEDVRLANVRAIQLILRGTRRNRPIRTGPSRTQPETNPDALNQPPTETGAIDANDAASVQANIDALSEYYGLQDHVRIARARLLNLTDIMADDWSALRRNAENLIGLSDGDTLERIAVVVEETSRDTSRMLINDYNRHVGSWYDQVGSMLDQHDGAIWNALVQPIRNKYLFTPQTINGLDNNGGGMLGAVMVGVVGAMMGLVIRDTIDGTNRADDVDVRSEWLREYRAAAPLEINMIDRMTITFDNQMPLSGYLAGAYMPNNPNRALDYTRALELSPVALDRIRVGTASALEKQAFVNLNFTGAMLPVVNFEQHVDERANMARLNDPSTTIRATLAARQQFVDETMASGYTFEEAVQIATDAIPYQIANEFQEQSMRSFLKDHIPTYARDLEANMMDVLNKRYPKKSKKSAGQIGAIKGIASMTLQEQAAFAELDRARNPEKYKSPVETRPLEVFMKSMNASDIFINSMLRPRQSSSIPGMQTPETNSQKR